MCGILGTVTAETSERTRYRAMELLRHRGPDGEGQWWSGGDPGVWFGHLRLKIQDLSDAAAQPMPSECEGFCLTYNGEIYNAPVLRERLIDAGFRFRTQGDTEVLLNSYRHWGPDCVHHLEGMFAFGIWDRSKGSLFLARDRLGMKPLYYSLVGDGIAFASEATALASLISGVRPPTVSPLALGYVLSYGYVPAPHAIWEGMRKLRPGHCMVFDTDGGARESLYWEPPRSLVTNAEHAEAGAFGELLENVVEEHLLSDVGVSTFLSGGNDSMAIATAVARNHGSGSEPPEAFTVGFAGGADESDAARKVAQLLKLKHEVTAVGEHDIGNLVRAVAASYDEPMAYSSILSMHQLCEATAPHFKVAISGDGGDEVFGGYRWYRNLRVSPRRCVFRAGLLALRRAATRWFRDPLRYRLVTLANRGIGLLHEHAWRVFPRFTPEEVDSLIAPTGLRFTDDTAMAPLRTHDEPDLPLLRRLQRIDLMTFSADHCCVKVDRGGMAKGLEVRTPLLDRRIVEWGLRRPVGAEEREVGKGVIKRYLAESMPRELVYARKKGFSVPLTRYLSKTELMERIDVGALVAGGYLSRNWRALVRGNHPLTFSRVWMLYIVSIWLEITLEKLQATE